MTIQVIKIGAISSWHLEDNNIVEHERQNLQLGKKTLHFQPGQAIK